MRRLKILTWHTHGGYLRYLTQAPHDFYVLSRPGRPPGYAGRSGQPPWGPNVHDLPAEQARRARFDLILFQDDPQYLDDQYELLTPAQRRLPKIYLEHDPPREHPVDSRHPVAGRDVLVVHCTHFNRLMWDNGAAPTRVVEHGVIDPGYLYTGELERGLVVVDDIARAGRRLGLDLYEEIYRKVKLDLVLHAERPAFAARYRFLFNPIRYASLGLALLEAMMAGLPVVALATTETATVVKDGLNGFSDTNPDALVENMRTLMKDRDLAEALGLEARRTALGRFGIERFVADWNQAFAEVLGERRERAA
ncbi:MAG: glycosyltransferase [Burkholderiales bacterium]